MSEEGQTGRKRGTGYKYVTSFVDRYGTRRYRFQKRGHKSIYLPPPDSPEFIDAYTDALQSLKKRRTRADDTLDAAIDRYLATQDFQALSSSSQKNYKRRLGKIGQKYGEYSIKTLQRHNLIQILEGIDSPAERNRALSLFGLVLAASVNSGHINHNVANTIKRAKHKESGFATWTREEIKKYLEYHKPESMAGRALLVLYFTGQRGSDAVRLSSDNLSNGRITLEQKKTGTPINIPLHPELAAVLPESGHWITTSRGVPFTANGFRNWFRKQVKCAGIESRSAHGLRKALASHLAEAGATPSQIAAVTGHLTLSEVARYTKAANAASMADQAFDKLGMSLTLPNQSK